MNKPVMSIFFWKVKALLCSGDFNKALEMLWNIRAEIIASGMQEKIKEIDELLLYALLQDRVSDWDDSMENYKEYLENFPDSLHNQLGERLVCCLEDKIKSDEVIKPKILDVFCGTGLVSKKMAIHNFREGFIVGIDGSTRMINDCVEWRDFYGCECYDFYHIPSECMKIFDSKFRYVTMNMASFQLDLRARHFLFQRILGCLEDKCSFFFTTYAADFAFSKDIEGEIPYINKVNPFKGVLLERFRQIGYNPGELESMITPTFTKENLHNLSCFFEFYGFQLVPFGEKEKDFIIVSRNWRDRVTFSRIPVISKKIYGQIIPDKLWSEIGDMPEYEDYTYGAVIEASRKKKPKKMPLLYSGVKVDFTKGYPIRYVVGAVLKNKEGKTLFVQRGDGARDHKYAWSLPTSFADDGQGLFGAFYQSLEKNLGIQQNELVQLEPLAIRFNVRETNGADNWIIAMCLFQGSFNRMPDLKTDKYNAYVWEDGYRFLMGMNLDEMGDCTLAYIDMMRSEEMT